MTYNEIIDSWQSSEINNLTKAGEYDRRRTEAAIKRQNELFESAKAFSSKLGEKLEQDKEIAQKRADAEAKGQEFVEALGLNQKYGKPLLTEEEAKEHEEGVKQVEKNRRKSEELASKHASNGGSQEEVTQIRNTGGDASYTAASTEAALLGKEYPAWLNGEMLSNDTEKLMLNGVEFTPKTAETPRQKEAARSALLKKYIIDNKIYYSKALLAEKGGMFESAINAHNAAAKLDSEEFAIEQGTLDVQQATQEFTVKKSYVTLLSSLQATTNPKAQPPRGFTRTGAHDKAMELVKKEMDLGRLQPDEFEFSMKTQIEDPPGSGKFVMLKDKIPKRYLEMKQHMDKAIVAQQDAADDKKKAAFQDAQIKIGEEIRQRIKDGLQVDSVYLQSKKTELLQNEDFFGMEPTLLNKFIENQSPGAIEQGNLRAKIDDMIKKNELTTPELMAIGDAELIEEYRSKAKIIDDLVSKHKKKDTEYLRGIVASKRSRLRFNEGEGNEGAMADYLVGQIYNNALTAAINADEKNPSGYARQVAEEWFDGFVKNRANVDFQKGFKVPGFNASPVDLSAATNRVTQKNKINKRINGVLRRNRDVNSLFTPENIDKIMTKERLEEVYTNNLADPNNLTYPQEVNTIYKSQPKGSVTKHQIIERIAKAHGMAPPPKSASMDLADLYLSKADQITMEYSGFNGSTRMLGKIGKNTDNLNIDYVPNGKGEEIFNYHKENGIEFGELASAYEFIVTHPTSAEGYGITPKSTSGKIDWDRVALASIHINSQIGESFQMGADTVQQVFKGVTTRLNKFRKDATPVLANYIKNRNVNDLKMIVQAAETTSGPATRDFIIEMLVEGTIDLSKWSSDRVNDLMNEILPDAPILTEEEKQSVKQAKYKNEPTLKNLSELMRPGFYGQ